MPTYIMLSTLTPEGIQTVRNNPQRIREVNKRGRAARRRGQGAVGHARLLRLRQHHRGARREDDGAHLARARLARDRPLRDADRDPDRRLHRSSLTPESSSIGGGGREHAIVRALLRSPAVAGGALLARATPGSRSRRRRSTAPTTRRRSPRPGSISWSSGRRPRSSRASSTAARRGRRRVRADAPPPRGSRAPRPTPRRSWRPRACRPRPTPSCADVEAGLAAITATPSRSRPTASPRARAS